MDFPQQASFGVGEARCRENVAVAARPRTPCGVTQRKSACSGCSLRELCLPMGLAAKDVAQLDQLVHAHRYVKRHEGLYRAGDPFGAIYAVRSGFFKSTVVLEDGRDQITGFHMPGELIGMDGIASDRYPSNALALEDSEVCAIPFSRLEEISKEVRTLQRQFHRILSRELLRDQGVMLLLGSMRADERLIAFLLNLSLRFAARGYSRSEFHLRMTREDIGSFLGLKFETVSRLFSRFQEENLVRVHKRHIRILDMDSLRKALNRGT